MSEGSVTRKLVRQEWKPIGGYREVRFVVATAGHALPGMEWTEDLAGKSEVVSEVIGYAEWPSGKHSPSHEEFGDFAAEIEEESYFVQWLNEWDEKAEAAQEVDEAFGEVAEKAAEEVAEAEERVDDPDLPEAPEASTDGAGQAQEDPERTVREDDLVVTVDDAGDRVRWEYDSEDEPYELPEDADDSDIMPGALYRSQIVNIETYGFFVQVYNTKGGDDVSGLVHRNQLGMQSPADFEEGDDIIVELENHDGGLSFIPHDADSESGLAELFDSVNETGGPDE